MADKTTFVTVGTTQFDDLIHKVTKKEVIEIVKKNGYSRMLLQIGSGIFEPPQSPIEDFKIEFYRLKDSIHEDLVAADLVISHAGAGTCFETLELGKPLIVVVNESLMDNHQSELADALHCRKYAVACNVDSLGTVLYNMRTFNFQKYPKSNPKVFNNYLNNLMGACSK